MSDNPSAGGEDLLRLGVDVDSGSFSALNAAVDALNARIDELIGNVAKIALTGDESAGKLLNSLQNIGQVSAESGTNIDALRKQVDALDAEYRQLGQTVDQTNDALSAAPNGGYSNNQIATGYGVKGGMVGPAESDGIETGSLFGVAHAASVAGHATGIGGLRDVGAFLYIEEGLKRVMPLFEQLDASLQASGGLIPPLTEGLSSLGVPMAGLLATAIPLGVAVGAAAVMTANFVKQIEDYNKVVQTASDTQVKYYEFVATSTTEDAKKRMEHDQVVQNANERAMGILRGQIAAKLREQGFSETDINDSIKKGEAPAGTQFDVYAALSPLYEQFKKLQTASDAAEQDMDALTNSINKGDFALNDAAKSWREMADDAAKRAQQDADYQRQWVADTEMSGKQALKRLDHLREESVIIQGQMDKLKPYISTNEELKKQYDALGARLKQTGDEINDLTNTIIPNTQALEAAGEAFKTIKKSAEEAAAQASRIGDAIAGFHKAQADGQAQLANQTENARLREGQAEEQYHKGSIQDIYERTRISLDEDRKELEARQQTADKIQDVTLKLYEKQYDIGLDYARQVQDDQTKLNNNLGKLAREGQYQQQEDQIDHQAKMAQLRERDIVADTQNLLDRNFKALYLAGLHKDQEARKEETDFAAKEAQQQRHRQQAATEAIIGAQQERQQQQVAYLRKMEDAQRQSANEIVQQNINEQRKIQSLQLAERQKLTDLTTSENFKIQVLRHGLQNELTLYAQQEKQRIEIARTTMSVIIKDALAQIGKVAQSNNAVNTGLGIAGGVFGALHNLHILDDGGSFSGGVPFMKGPISEGFDFGGGRGFALGGGSALVFPLQGGTATPQGGSSHKNITLAPTFNIYEATDIRRIKGELLDMLDEVQN